MCVVFKKARNKLYKLLTVVIFDKVYAHREQNTILTEEQNSVYRNSRSYKDLVTIDSFAVLQAKEH